TILSLLFWQTCAPKKLKLVPAPLVALLVASAVYSGWRAWGGWPELRRVPMPDNLGEAVRFPDWGLLSRCLEGPVLAAMATIAFIASAETLLCAAAVDAMQR